MLAVSCCTRHGSDQNSLESLPLGLTKLSHGPIGRRHLSEGGYYSSNPVELKLMN
jgi:hypothetical protein